MSMHEHVLAHCGMTVALLQEEKTYHVIEDSPMLWTIAVILFILWALGFFAFSVGGGLIHILLVIALIVVVYRLITGRRVV
jgi:uncharacterized membrane protein